ncbi:MAG TPA: zf-HC2 domain-containing protein [Bryobacteraceae bacterium]|jgi:anti-sigma factor RsiW
MPCAAFEDLVRGYDDLPAGERRNVDAHLAVCSDCRDYVETLAALDRELVSFYDGFHLRNGFAANVVSRARVYQPSAYQPPRRPSAWPEVLDFCGWAAIVAIVALLAVTAAARAGITL